MYTIYSRKQKGQKPRLRNTRRKGKLSFCESKVTVMRLTREADYALRIMYTLALRGEKTDAQTIAQNAAITRRFALKILAKLADGGLVQSKLGAGGGYSLARSPEQIPLSGILECIEGPVAINACLSEGYICERVGDCDTCVFHHMLDAVNDTVREKLSAVSLYDAVHTPPAEIRKIILGPS